MPWPPAGSPPGPKLLTREEVINDIKIIVAKGFEFQKKLISEDPIDIEERRQLLRENPEEVRYQITSFFKFLERVWPTKVLHESVSSPRKRITPEDIEALGLSPEQLKKLAGIRDAQ